jgi:hypothetical protein
MDKGENSLQEVNRQGDQQQLVPDFSQEQPIPRYSKESLVQATRDEVAKGTIPNVDFANVISKAFREAVQHTINKPDPERGNSGDSGREQDPDFYKRRTLPGDPTSNQDDNKKGDHPLVDAINSHKNHHDGNSHRNPELPPPVPKTPNKEDWINKHAGQKPAPWRPANEGNRTQGVQSEEREDRTQGQHADKRQGQQPEDDKRVEGQPPPDKGPINEHHNEKPAKPDDLQKPKPHYTLEDLENADGNLPPSQVPPRTFPEFFFNNPVRPR